MYLPRLTTISPKHFLVSNILGRTCWAVLITLIGIYGMHPLVAFWIIAVLAISIYFGAPWKLSTAHAEPINIHTLTEELMDNIYSLVSETQKELTCVSHTSLNPILP
jgi:hypothetical protein